MRRMLLAATAGLIAFPALAHDFWIQPQSFWVRPGERVPMVLLVGHGTARQRSTIPANRFTLFRASGANGVANRLGEMTVGGATDATLAFDAPGTYVVFFSTSAVPSELPAPRFNEYASAEGLSLVLSQRAANRTSNRPGRELYSRRGKAIIQVGMPGSAAQPQVTRPVGLGLEIVPLSNPYSLGKATQMTVQILYQGRPLPGALVKLNNLAADAKPVEVHRSDVAGRATFQARRAGRWQFNVVWSQPLANNPTADYLTTFSSLTFGFPAAGSAR